MHLGSNRCDDIQMVMTRAIPPPPAYLVTLMEQSFAPQRPFAYRRESWLKQMRDVPGAREAIERLPDLVDRQAIKQAFVELEDDNLIGAFIAVMIWGYGTRNYGPYRTLRVLSDDFKAGKTLSNAVATKLRHSVVVARQDGNTPGYSYLNNEGKMRKFGASFFTKWLYYITATGPQGDWGAAPILDDEIIAWLRPQGEKLVRGKTPDYKRYIDVVTHWGSPYGLSAVEVEERVFRLIRDDGPQSSSTDF